jgi:hypothetical protein
MRRLVALAFAGVLAFTLAAFTGAGDKKQNKQKPLDVEQLRPAILASVDKKKDPGNLPLVERGPEHKILENLVGEWDVKVRFYFPDPKKPSESKGIMTRNMILGGNFLQESFTGEFVGQPFAGLSLIGFDANKERFVTIWCDSMSTSMSQTQGIYDERKKALTSLGELHDPNTKKMMRARDVLRIISKDEQLLEMYRQPKGAPEEFKIMEVVYTRKKAKKE